MPVDADILEDDITRLSPELLNILLKDHTTSSEDIQLLKECQNTLLKRLF